LVEDPLELIAIWLGLGSITGSTGVPPRAEGGGASPGGGGPAGGGGIPTGGGGIPTGEALDRDVLSIGSGWEGEGEEGGGASSLAEVEEATATLRVLAVLGDATFPADIPSRSRCKRMEMYICVKAASFPVATIRVEISSNSAGTEQRSGGIPWGVTHF